MFDRPENDVPVTLRYIVYGVNEAVDSTQRVENAVAGLSQAYQSTEEPAQGIKDVSDESTVASTNVSGLGVQLRGVSQELRAVSSLASNSGLSGIGSGVRVVAEISRAADALPRFADTVGKLSSAVVSGVVDVGNGVKNWVEGLSYAEGTLGSVGAVASDAIKPVSSLAVGIGAVTVAAIPVAIAVAGIAVELQNFNQVIADGKKQLDAALSTEQAYFQDEGKLTTEQAKAKRDSLQIQADEEAKAAAEAQAALQRTEDQSHGVLPVGSIASKALFGDLYKNLDDAQKHLDDTNAAIGRLNGGLASDAFAANDVVAGIDKQIASQKEYNQLMQSGSLDDVNKRIKDDQDQINSYNDALDKLNGLLDESIISQDQYNQKQGEYQTKLRSLYDDQTKLSNTVLPAVKQRIDDLSKSFLDFSAVIEESKAAFADMQKIAANQKAYDATTAQTLADRQIRDSRQDADFQTAKSNKITDFYANQAQQDSDFYEGEADKLAKLSQSVEANLSKVQQNVLKESEQYAQRQKDNAAKEQKDIQSILDKSRESELDAASRLDARSVAQQERQKQAQITSVADTYNTQKAISDRSEQQKLTDEIQQAKTEHDQKLAEGLATVQDEEKQYQEKRRRDEDKFKLDLKRADDQEKLKEDRQKEDDARQDTIRTKAFTDQQNVLYVHMDRLLGIQTTGQNNLQTSSGNFWGSVVTTANNYFAQLKAPVASSAPTPAPSASDFGVVRGGPNVDYSSLGTNVPPQFANTGSSNFVPPTTNSFDAPPITYSPVAVSAGDLGYASGGEPPVNTPVSVAEGGNAEIAIFGERAKVVSGSDTRRILDAIDSSSENVTPGKSTKSLTINGPLIGSINGSNLSEQQLTSAIEKAVESYVNKELEGLV